MGCTTNHLQEIPMRHRHDTRPDDLRQPGWDVWIADGLGLSDYSDAAPRTVLARCLLLAAALHSAVSAVARKAADLGREVVRRGLAASRPADPRDLERRLAGGFRRALPRGFRGRRIPIAIDIHKRAYYGDHDRTPGITGGKRDAGTSYFWSYATAVALTPGHRHTLALTAVEPSETPTDVVDRLLAQVLWAGAEVRYVLLDRAFYAVGVVNASARRNVRFIIPMMRRGADGRAFFRRGSRGWFDHTVRSRNRTASATIRVAVVPGPDGNRPLVFACSNGFHALPDVALTYARRFGIETSYRQLGECLAKTTSRDLVYRLMLVGVSLLIRARWVESRGVTLTDIRLALILDLTRSTTDSQHPATQPVPPHEPETT
jgi:putative transposase